MPNSDKNTVYGNDFLGLKHIKDVAHSMPFFSYEQDVNKYMYSNDPNATQTTATSSSTPTPAPTAPPPMPVASVQDTSAYNPDLAGGGSVPAPVDPNTGLSTTQLELILLTLVAFIVLLILFIIRKLLKRKRRKK